MLPGQGMGAPPSDLGGSADRVTRDREARLRFGGPDHAVVPSPCVAVMVRERLRRGSACRVAPGASPGHPGPLPWPIDSARPVIPGPSARDLNAARNLRGLGLGRGKPASQRASVTAWPESRRTLVRAEVYLLAPSPREMIPAFGSVRARTTRRAGSTPGSAQEIGPGWSLTRTIRFGHVAFGRLTMCVARSPGRDGSAVQATRPPARRHGAVDPVAGVSHSGK